MSNALVYQVYELQGLPFTDKTILSVLAFAAPKDGDTVNIQLETIARRAGCAIRTVQYSLRRLESLEYLVREGEKGGRGHALRLKIVLQKSVESSPVVPPEHIPPPTNGHAPVPPPPRDPYTPDPLSDEEVKARHAQWAAKRAEMAAKPRPEKKHERPGRTARESARLVSGQSPVGGDTGGDAAP